MTETRQNYCYICGKTLPADKFKCNTCKED